MIGIERKRWAERAAGLRLEQLSAFRSRAEQWRNGLAALTTILAVVTIVKGPETIGDLSAGTRDEVIRNLTFAFFALLVGTLLSMYAAFGAPGRRKIWSGERLAAWEGKQVTISAWCLRGAALLLVVGVVLVADATRLTLTDEKPSPKQLVLVAATGLSDPKCGVLTASGPRALKLAVKVGFKDPQVVRIPYDEVLRLEPVSSCP